MGHSMMGRTLLERALCVMDELGVPDHSDACISALALAIMAMVRTSPEDQAEQVAVIARMMARRT